VIAGAEATVKVAVPFVTPKVVMVIVTLPGFLIKSAGTAAVNRVSLTNLVGSNDPFHATVASDVNAVPFTASFSGGPPATVEEGLKDVGG
jgi:hypothetical protein